MYCLNFWQEVDMEELKLITIRFIILSTIYLQWISCGFYLVADLVQWRYVKKADYRWANEIVSKISKANVISVEDNAKVVIWLQ